MKPKIMLEEIMEFSCLFYQEGNSWIAQCLEYDITAQAPSLLDAHERFIMKVVAEFVIAMDLKREPFHGLGPAPDEFWREFKESKMDLTADTPPFKIANDVEMMPWFLSSMKIGQGPVAAVA